MVPAVLEDDPAHPSDPVAHSHGRPRAFPVLDLPGPLAERVGTARADDDLGVVTEMHQPGGFLDHAAAPALRAAGLLASDGSTGGHVGVSARLLLAAVVLAHPGRVADHGSVVRRHAVLVGE